VVPDTYAVAILLARTWARKALEERVSGASPPGHVEEKASGTSPPGGVVE
jgi:hypothetical protein